MLSSRVVLHIRWIWRLFIWILILVRIFFNWEHLRWSLWYLGLLIHDIGYSHYISLIFMIILIISLQNNGVFKSQRWWWHIIFSWQWGYVLISLLSLILICLIQRFQLFFEILSVSTWLNEIIWLRRSIWFSFRLSIFNPAASDWN